MSHTCTTENDIASYQITHSLALTLAVFQRSDNSLELNRNMPWSISDHVVILAMWKWNHFLSRRLTYLSSLRKEENQPIWKMIEFGPRDISWCHDSHVVFLHFRGLPASRPGRLRSQPLSWARLTLSTVLSCGRGGRERQTRHTYKLARPRALSLSPALSARLRFEVGTPHDDDDDVVHAACRAAPRQDCLTSWDFWFKLIDSNESYPLWNNLVTYLLQISNKYMLNKSFNVCIKIGVKEFSSNFHKNMPNFTCFGLGKRRCHIFLLNNNVTNLSYFLANNEK